MLNLLLVDFKTSCYYSIKPAVVSGSLAPSSVHVTNPQDTADLASHFPPANFDQIPVLSTRVYRGTVLSESQVPFQYDLDYNSIISQRIRWHMTYRRVPLAVSAWIAMLTRINLNNRWTRTISTVSSSLSLFRHTYQIRTPGNSLSDIHGFLLTFPQIMGQITDPMVGGIWSVTGDLVDHLPVIRHKVGFDLPMNLKAFLASMGFGRST